MNEMSDATLSVIIFVLVMVVIISEKVHRAVCAVGGAVLLIILGVLDIGTGVSYIDYNTIGLLIGMMMFVAVVKHSGDRKSTRQNSSHGVQSRMPSSA